MPIVHAVLPETTHAAIGSGSPDFYQECYPLRLGQHAGLDSRVDETGSGKLDTRTLAQRTYAALLRFDVAGDIPPHQRRVRH